MKILTIGTSWRRKSQHQSLYKEENQNEEEDLSL